MCDDDVVQPSHLDASPSGRLFTALVRGRDSVSVFDATPRGPQGGADAARPRLASEHQIGAALPRHHAHLDDRTVVVAAQQGNALVEVANVGVASDGVVVSTPRYALITEVQRALVRPLIEYDPGSDDATRQ